MHRDTVLRHADDQVSALVDGEVVAMRVSDGVYLPLDASGSRVWQLLAEPTTFGVLCDRLVGEYDVDRGACEQDVAALAKLMTPRRRGSVKAKPLAKSRKIKGDEWF